MNICWLPHFSLRKIISLFKCLSVALRVDFCFKPHLIKGIRYSWFIVIYIYLGYSKACKEDRCWFFKRKGLKLTFAFFEVLMICMKARVITRTIVLFEFTFEFLWNDLKQLWESKEFMWSKHPIGFCKSLPVHMFPFRRIVAKPQALTAGLILWQETTHYTSPTVGIISIEHQWRCVGYHNLISIFWQKLSTLLLAFHFEMPHFPWSFLYVPPPYFFPSSLNVIVLGSKPYC